MCFISRLRLYLIATTNSFFKDESAEQERKSAHERRRKREKVTTKADEGANAVAKALQDAAQKAKAKDGKAAKSKES